MHRFHLFVVLANCAFILFGDKPQIAQNPKTTSPDCSKPTPPFTNKTEAFAAAHEIEACWYIFFKQYEKVSDNPYHAMVGFRKMFGDEGYLYNKSTIYHGDDDKVQGYGNLISQAVVGQNLMSWTAPPHAWKHVSWSAYEVTYVYTVNITMCFGVLKGTQQAVEMYVTSTWFEDDSGIIQYTRSNSTASLIGRVVSNTFKVTRGIAGALGYLHDDGDIDGYGSKYIENPIQFIFICVFCVLTVGTAICAYGLLRCFSFARFIGK
eukprot:55540_1